jgi:hypothetical protein
MNSSNEFKSIKEIVDKNYDKRVLIYKEVENKILNNELFEINKSNLIMTTNNSYGTYESGFHSSDLVENNISSDDNIKKSEEEKIKIQPETQNIINEIYQKFYECVDNKGDGNELLKEFRNYCNN